MVQEFFLDRTSPSTWYAVSMRKCPCCVNLKWKKSVTMSSVSVKQTGSGLNHQNPNSPRTTDFFEIIMPHVSHLEQEHLTAFESRFYRVRCGGNAFNCAQFGGHPPTSGFPDQGSKQTKTKTHFAWVPSPVCRGDDIDKLLLCAIGLVIVYILVFVGRFWNTRNV